MRHPLFLDDDCVANALNEASDLATRRLANLLPELNSAHGKEFRKQLRAHLAHMLAGKSVAQTTVQPLPPLVHGEDVFGDRFSLETLPLPRAGTGYAVQLLDTDSILDSASSEFLPVRSTTLEGLFETFDSALAAARCWLRRHEATIDQYPLAIVPAYYDYEMNRHVLVYGVLNQTP